MGAVFNPRQDTSGAFRSVVGLIKKVATQIGGFAGSASTAADPTCDRLAGLGSIPPLVRGIVLRSGIGSYDCEVQIAGGQVVVCSAVMPVLSDVYGVSQASMPVPGSCVLVYVQSVGLARKRVARGYILGIVADNNTGGVSLSGTSKITRIPDTDFPEGGVAQYTESGPDAVASDKKYPYKGAFPCGRPHDIVPGEYGLLNHAGAGLVIGAVSTTVKGSETASVRCSALDDQVRVVSGHFRHINAAGSHEIYNDGGFISVESSVSLYQSERLGVKGQGRAAFTESPASVLSLQEKQSSFRQLKPTQTAKKRLYQYAGYLGDILNVFVATPDPDKDVEDMASESKDQGLFHTHIDTSGRFTMRSASGILFERYDRIPIPKRKTYAWDPAGDHADSSSATEKKAFVHPVNYPMGIGVTLADRAAWWDYLSYERFRQFKKDFKVPEQKDLKCPDDLYDELGRGKEDFQTYDTRHSYIGLTPDGGIVLRDAWGSEIVMADGRITLNAAANIEVRSGSSVVILGGDDVIAKAYNSLDLSATEKDVRIKSEKNLQIVSTKSGVLIQSKAADRGKQDWKKSGEELESAGVVIKSDKSAVAILGKTAEIQAENGVKLAAYGEDGPKGDVVIAGRQVSSVASGNVVMTASGTSGVILSGQSAVIAAPSVLAVGGQSAATVSGNNLMLGIPVEIGSLYAQTISTCKSQAQQYLDAVEWLNPVPPSVFSSVDFRFRTSEQYGTLKDSGISGGTFSVYQPSWVLLAGSRKWMKACRVRAWEEHKDADGGFPWPGEAAMKAGYVTCEKELNVNGEGVETPKTEQAVLTPKAFSSYHIRERN